jgi:hypothetical protein
MFDYTWLTHVVTKMHTCRVKRVGLQWWWFNIIPRNYFGEKKQHICELLLHFVLSSKPHITRKLLFFGQNFLTIFPHLFLFGMTIIWSIYCTWICGFPSFTKTLFSTALTLCSDASVCSMNCPSSLGQCNKGLVHICCFSRWKFIPSSSFQHTFWGWSFFVKSESFADWSAKWGMNLW